MIFRQQQSRWRDAHFSGSLFVGTLTLSGNTIVDSTGTLSFDDENLTTTGNINGGAITGTSLVASDTVNTVTLVPGSITDTTGAITFGAVNLSTTGTLGAGVTTLTSSSSETVILNPDNGSSRASITSSLGSIDFGDEDLYTTGALNVGTLVANQLDVDNIRLDGNTISTTDTNGNLILLPNGIGVIDAQKTLNTVNMNTTGTHTVTGILNVDNVRIDGNTVQSTNLNADLTLAVNGTGNINFGASLIPTVSGSQDIGSGSALINDMYLSGGIRDATNEIAIATLLAFRSGVWRDLAQTQPAQDGDSIFYNGANNVWLASRPDSEIDHGDITGLLDDDHTQYMLLAGRPTGQTLIGGTAASENLTLQSTSNATRGAVLTADNFLPATNATFSGGWSGLDLGSASFAYNDIYSRGEHKNLRFENFTEATLPTSSGQNIGRVMYATDSGKAYVDTGTAIKTLGVSKFVGDVVFDGVQLVADVDVSSDIQDARNAVKTLLNNSNDFSTMYVTLKATSASNIRIETEAPLPAGSYRLVVIE